MRQRIDVPVGWDDFPQRCVKCGTLPEATVDVTCRRGFDAIVFRYFTYYAFKLPVCFPCKRRRRLAGFLSIFFTLAAIFAILVGLIVLEPIFERWGQRELWAFSWIGVLLAVLLLARNKVTPLLDDWFLGVHGGRLSKTNVGTLWFRENDFVSMTRAFIDKDKKVGGNGA